MFDTVMPRAFAAATSTQSVPVAATAISLSRGAAAIATSRTGVLLVMTISASAMRSATSSGRDRSWLTQLWAKLGLRSTVSGDSVERSRKTMRGGAASVIGDPWHGGQTDHLHRRGFGFSASDG